MLTHTQNSWIIKPGNLSRGRGIACYSTLQEIIKYINNTQTQWIIMKYIERPLIIHQLKVKAIPNHFLIGFQFDIRQWVVISCLEPLTIWFFNECYVRFATEKYDPENLNQKFAHLTNNSIVKHSLNFGKQIEGNMWSEAQLKKYLKEKEGNDIWTSKIKPQMKKISALTFQGSNHKIGKRENTFEIFGFDFMIDEKYRVWLIEVNKSPALEYSTVTTERMSRQIQRDIAKLINRFFLNDQQNQSGKVKNKGTNTNKQLGNLTLIFKDKYFK